MVGSSSVHEQTASSSLLTIKPNQNLIIDLNPFLYDPYMLQVVECLKYSPLMIAITQVESVLMSLLSQVYTTTSYDKSKERIFFEIFNHKTSVSRVRFCSMLSLASDDSLVNPDSISTTQLFTMFYDMGYTDFLTTVTKLRNLAFHHSGMDCLPFFSKH